MATEKTEMQRHYVMVGHYRNRSTLPYRPPLVCHLFTPPLSLAVLRNVVRTERGNAQTSMYPD